MRAVRGAWRRARHRPHGMDAGHAHAESRGSAWGDRGPRTGAPGVRASVGMSSTTRWRPGAFPGATSPWTNPRRRSPGRSSRSLEYHAIGDVTTTTVSLGMAGRVALAAGSPEDAAALLGAFDNLCEIYGVKPPAGLLHQMQSAGLDDRVPGRTGRGDIRRGDRSRSPIQPGRGRGASLSRSPGARRDRARPGSWRPPRLPRPSRPRASGSPSAIFSGLTMNQSSRTWL